jgi:DNA-binding MarR family transcriptional regulator
MSNPTISLADDLVVSAVRLTRWLKAADSAARLSGPQASALAIIVYAGKITPSQLAQLEQVQRPTIARVISQLTDAGLVTRKGDERDRRSSWIAPTPAGKTLIRQGQLRRIEPLVERMQELKPTELKTLRDGLTVIHRLIDPPIASMRIAATAERGDEGARAVRPRGAN